MKLKPNLWMIEVLLIRIKSNRVTEFWKQFQKSWKCSIQSDFEKYLYVLSWLLLLIRCPNESHPRIKSVDVQKSQKESILLSYFCSDSHLGRILKLTAMLTRDIKPKSYLHKIKIGSIPKWTDFFKKINRITDFFNKHTTLPCECESNTLKAGRVIRFTRILMRFIVKRTVNKIVIYDLAMAVTCRFLWWWWC